MLFSARSEDPKVARAMKDGGLHEDLARPLPAAECESWLREFVRWPSTVGHIGPA